MYVKLVSTLQADLDLAVIVPLVCILLWDGNYVLLRPRTSHHLNRLTNPFLTLHLDRVHHLDNHPFNPWCGRQFNLRSNRIYTLLLDQLLNRHLNHQGGHHLNPLFIRLSNLLHIQVLNLCPNHHGGHLTNPHRNLLLNHPNSHLFNR